MTYLIGDYLAFGFLAGKEAKAAGIVNAGLKDRTSCARSHSRTTLIIKQSASHWNGSRNISVPSGVIMSELQCTQRQLIPES